MHSLTQLAHALRTGELELVQYLAELEITFNQREPHVLAFVPEEGRFDRLRRAAVRLLRDYPDPATRPALFGVPLGVKDIFHVDGLPTRGGSRVPTDVVQSWGGGVQAESVTRTRQAGALILGKTVTTEFAYFGAGPTRNPHNAAHTPGGSSSGSAAAVGAGICPLTLGTQTIGSITRPAAYCGAVGYKPSYERISRAGVIPLSPALDHIGPFANDVAGVALAASVLVADWQGVPSLNLNPSAVRLGIPSGNYLQNASSQGLQQFATVVTRLQSAGFVTVHVPVMPDFADIYDRHQRIVAADAARVHANWFAHWADHYQPKTQDLIRRGKTISAEQYAKDCLGREALRSALHTAMDEHQLHLWISPSAPDIAPHGLESTGNPVMNLPFSQAGLPTLGIPSGWEQVSGLPFGLQLAARFGQDEQLMALGMQIEAILAS
ncbi:MAG TPA: amidase [Anaerolineales bacterium]|nr:amidase [Anaerolineales bacterium]